MTALAEVFQRTRAESRLAFIPFLPAGFPDVEATRSMLPQLTAAGADIVEVGFPFSDPVADGPVIQAAYTHALCAGVRVADVMTCGRETKNVVAMASYSLMWRVGVTSFLNELKANGFVGLIVPDLPLEGAAKLRPLADERGLDLILLVTPTTPLERAKRIADTATGFLYCVSVAGITGARDTLPVELLEQLAQLRAVTPVPLCVGFGVSTPAHVRALHGSADGVIVGSALVRMLQRGGAPEMITMANELAAACRP